MELMVFPTSHHAEQAAMQKLYDSDNPDVMCLIINSSLYSHNLYITVLCVLQDLLFENCSCVAENFYQTQRGL